MRLTLLLFFVCLTVALTAQTTVLFEDFEDATITYTSSVPEAIGASNRDYFTRTDGSNISSTFSNIQGTSFFAAQDIDGAVSGFTQSLFFSGIDISSASAFNFSMFIAEDDDGNNQDWDTNDHLRAFYSIDGGQEILFFAVEGEGGTNTAPRIDTNLDGTGDGAEITDAFSSFSTSFAASGTTMAIRLEFSLDSGDEDIAIDNVMLETAAAVCNLNISTGGITYACQAETDNPDMVTVSLPYVGIDADVVLSSSPALINTGDDPAVTVDGTIVFTVTEGVTYTFSISSPNCGTIASAPLGVPSSFCAPAPPVVINEFMNEPGSADANGDGTLDGSDDEFVEIYNTSSSPVDIGGWTIADNFSVRHIFPAGTMIPGEQAIVIFGGGTLTFACHIAASSGSLGLNNGGDNITLADAAGNTVDLVSGDAPEGKSFARDVDGTGIFVNHNAITSNPVDLSPCMSNHIPATFLPVTLTNLAAERMGKTAMVKWSTATESGNSHFVVERSQNGRLFTEVGRVDGAGDSYGAVNYDFTDVAPANGENYYRLRQVDLTGAATVFGPVMVSFEGEGLTAFPNPVGNRLYVSGAAATSRTTILDLNGRVLSNDLNTGNGIATGKLAPGTYLLRVESAEGTETLRFVKQ